jgi:hypothetical protein
LADLKPYACTFKDCIRQDHLFKHRQEWFNHEWEFHRREWFCNVCPSEDDEGKNTYNTKQLFREHLQSQHADLFDHSKIETVMTRCERPAITLQQTCPLCLDQVHPALLRRHLGKHMQQLSVFVLRSLGIQAKKDQESKGSKVADHSTLDDLEYLPLSDSWQRSWPIPSVEKFELGLRYFVESHQNGLSTFFPDSESLVSVAEQAQIMVQRLMDDSCEKKNCLAVDGLNSL